MRLEPEWSNVRSGYISGRFEDLAIRSALPPKQTLSAENIIGPEKRTLNVRLTPVSGPNSTIRWMSAYYPKRT